MRIVVIGATGHVGGYLVPRLVRAGHDVLAVSRGTREPYHPDPAWAHVTRIQADRTAEDADGTFAGRIASLAPDVVIDMLCFTPASAQHLVDGLRGRIQLLVHCGTIWVHGPATEVPVREDAPRRPFGAYGTGKAAIEQLLRHEWQQNGFPSIVLHPGHISGPGWPIINPAGNLDLGVWNALATGAELPLPNFGLETVHHVHADDVAQAFERAVTAPEPALGESFHVVSDRAITLRGFAEAVAGWFGQTANLRFLPFADFASTVGAKASEATKEHIARSPSMSIAKARQVLGYEPRYTSLQAAAEAVVWLQANGRLAPTVPPISADLYPSA
jgi:nucleoside-diphosphate-sugar epimerase